MQTSEVESGKPCPKNETEMGEVEAKPDALSGIEIRGANPGQGRRDELSGEGGHSPDQGQSRCGAKQAKASG